jgi:DNA-directed RNA polymerase subunit K/omega
MLTDPDHQAMLHNKDLDLVNKFFLITLVRKRSHSLVEGSMPLIDNVSLNPVSTALREIAAGKVKIGKKDGRAPEVLAADNAQAAALAAVLGSHSLSAL